MGPNWLELPRDITSNILQRLGPVEILKKARNVCPYWWNICKDPLMWRTIHMSNNETSPDVDLVKICRYAVGQSCGHLEDIEIVSFCTDDLLHYIASCGSHLRHMQLTKCRNILHKQISEVAIKFPLLEELDISFSNLCKDSLEVIGRSCPLLKSLKFSRMFSKDIELNDDAFAIAKTMPKLRHLSMFGNLLTNVGLHAILDGCPLLESLVLRDCNHLDLSGSFGKRCRDQIKDFVLPTCVDENSDDEDDDSFYLRSLMEDQNLDYLFILRVIQKSTIKSAVRSAFRTHGKEIHSAFREALGETLISKYFK
ncbi:putative F-box/LRR-repeat protein 23 [Medicago truncatula]|uniref:putative F-box/LRR-repeat protein 23 n=1 Tax=Medicago truncatula TaxID=3880 RepID=UPI000D2F2B1F|nr:putative F-box/LRR-repeat protein 23 [Medicago truncatula]